MCGISGTFAYAGSPPPDPELLARMVAAMAHRGPDDHQIFVDGPVGFGHRRLSIIDVDGGNQPIPNEDGTVWIIYNGEIYNYRELRPELEKLGHTFKTQSDT